MSIEEAVVLVQRGYDKGIAGTSRGQALDRISRSLRRVEEAPPGSFDRSEEERHVGAALAEDVGILIGLTARPGGSRPGAREASDVLSRLLHLVGRSRALEEQISKLVAEAAEEGESWKDIAEVLGLSEEEVLEIYG